VSYILDALKKAAEQRGGSAAVLLRPAPTLARAVGGRRAPWIVVGIFLVLNVAGLIYLVRPAGVGMEPAPKVSTDRPSAARAVKAIRDAGPATASPLRGVIEAKPPRRAERLSTSVAKPAEPPVMRPAPEVRAPAVETTAAVEAKPAREPKPTVEPTPTLESKPSLESKPTVDAPIVPAPPKSPDTAKLPPRTAETAKLRLEVLSYSSIPAERLVFINGRRYKEGDALENGAKVEEIREDGVVLSEHGRRFTLR
jgi:general secretion pathway protein B